MSGGIRDTMEEGLAKAREEIEHLTAKLRCAEKEKEAVIEHLKTIDHEHTAATSRMRALESDLRKCVERIGTLENEVRGLTQEIGRLHMENRHLREIAARLQQENQQLQQENQQIKTVSPAPRLEVSEMRERETTVAMAMRDDSPMRMARIVPHDKKPTAEVYAELEAAPPKRKPGL